MQTPPAAVELRDGLAVEAVHAQLALCLHLREVGLRGLAFYLADMHIRRLHQASGHPSTVHFAQERLELSRRRAYELVAVGRALRELPHIDAAFCEGRVGWSKLVLLARVATPRHEQAWLERAQASTWRALRLAVRTARAGDAPRAPGSSKGLPEIRFDLQARIDALTHRKVELAKAKLTAERGEPIDDASFLATAAELILGSDDDGSLPGRERVDASLYRIVVHAQPTPALDTPDGPLPLGPEADCLLCDGECASDQPDQPDQVRDVATPPALRRRVLARDAQRCRHCGCRDGLMVHHIHHRARGGRTKARNLITLCTGCHALVHADLLVLRGTHAERIAFEGADGAPTDGRQPAQSPGIRLLPPAPAAAEDPAPEAAKPPAPVPFEQAFAGIVGEDERLERLRWVVEGSRARASRMPHVLFAGPPGTGKTTFARALAAHLGRPLVTAHGPSLQDLRGLRALEQELGTEGLLFVDEIHALPRTLLEALYQRMDAPGCTLLAATTDEGALPPALRSRFGLVEALAFHDEASLTRVADAHARREGFTLSERAARAVARCARGTPREARRLVARVLDAAADASVGSRVRAQHAQRTLTALGFDADGLGPLEQRYLATLRTQRGPVALGRLAAILGVPARTLLACVEPWLSHRGWLEITRQGRAPGPGWRTPHAPPCVAHA